MKDNRNKSKRFAKLINNGLFIEILNKHLIVEIIEAIGGHLNWMKCGKEEEGRKKGRRQKSGDRRKKAGGRRWEMGERNK